MKNLFKFILTFAILISYATPLLAGGEDGFKIDRFQVISGKDKNGVSVSVIKDRLNKKVVSTTYTGDAGDEADRLNDECGDKPDCPKS